jgi:hypothetical protein
MVLTQREHIKLAVLTEQREERFEVEPSMHHHQFRKGQG